MSTRQEDLDWLARNVHEWPAGKHQPWCYVFKTKEGITKASGNFLAADSQPTLVTIDDWEARRAELQSKPSWSSAPEWASWLAQDSYGCWGWFQQRPVTQSLAWLANSGYYSINSPGHLVLDNWRDTLEQRPDMHKSPEKIDTSAERVQKSAESIHVEPNSKPVRATNGTVLLEQPGVVAGTGAAMSIGKWAAEHSGRSPSDQIREAVINEALRILRDNPDHLAAEELADLHDLCDAELTKRDVAVCGGQKYLDAHWHERGELPPVGVKCEMFSVDDWEPVFIVGYSADGYMVVEMECEFITATQANKFRPIRPERNELIEIILSCNMSEGVLADAILAAGFTKGGAV